MTAPKPEKASAEFIRLLKAGIDEHPDKPSLREVARRTDLSVSYLSYLLAGERPAPSNDAMHQLEKVLNLPEGALHQAAGRPDDRALEFFRKEEAAPIMGMLANVPASKLPAVRDLIEQFLKKQTKRKK